MPITLPWAILVVDDDPLIRMATGDMLESIGLDVLFASSADEALGVLQNQPIAAIVTDVVMPGTLDGLGLVSMIRRRWPAIRIVVTSGHVPAEAAGNAANTAFLQKPFQAGQLLEALDLPRVASAQPA